MIYIFTYNAIGALMTIGPFVICIALISLTGATTPQAALFALGVPAFVADLTSLQLLFLAIPSRGSGAVLTKVAGGAPDNEVDC